MVQESPNNIFSIKSRSIKRPALNQYSYSLSIIGLVTTVVD